MLADLEDHIFQVMAGPLGNDVSAVRAKLVAWVRALAGHLPEPGGPALEAGTKWRDGEVVNDDEQAIHDLVAEWQRATTAGEADNVLSLMADDALFLVPGQEPFSKQAFAGSFTGLGDVRIEGRSEIQELEITGDWAWIRTHIDVTMTPPDGAPQRRSGHTLTILQKHPDGRWMLARDANLLPPPSSSASDR